MKLNRHNPFTLRPRYLGSYVAMAYGLVTLVAGHLRSAVLTAPVGELMLYGGLLYHARKRQRFESKRIWPAVEVYAGLSMIWMIVNILKIQIWRWQPVVFGMVPALIIAAYAVVFLGRTSIAEKGPAGVWSCNPKQIPLLLTVVALWFFLNFYALPRLHITT